jgi:hypothetical protein
MDLMMMERVGDRWGKLEGFFLTGQSPQWAVVPVEEELDWCRASTFMRIFLALSGRVFQEG